MDQESKILKAKKYFPLYLIHFTFYYFSANIDAIYFLEILITLEREWKIDDFAIIILICCSSLSLIFGNYFSILFLRFNIRNTLFASFLFQAISCIIGSFSFSQNLLVFCILKGVYNFFFAISSKIIVILPFLNKHSENSEKKQGNLLLFLFQTCQILIKVWVCLTCFLIPNLGWWILSINNSLSSIFSLIGVIFMIKRKKEFMKYSSDINKKNDQSTKKHNKKNFIFILMALFTLFELINNQALVKLFFIDQNTREALYQTYVFIIGDFIGLILSLLDCISFKSEKMSQLLLIIYGGILFYLCLNIREFWKNSIFLIIFRSLLLLLKNIIFSKFHHSVNKFTKIILVLIVNDSILAVVAILFFRISKQYFNNLLAIISSGIILIILFCLIMKEGKEKKQLKNEFEMKLLK